MGNLRGKRMVLFTLFLLLGLSGFSVLIHIAAADTTTLNNKATTSANAKQQLTVKTAKQADVNEFPQESLMQTAAENTTLLLKADHRSGHFVVVNKRSGKIWRSFPDPVGWDDKANTGAWKVHLRSPFMLRYVEFSDRADIVKESNLYDQKGTVTSFELTKQGFNITYQLPNLGFVIPIQVKLQDDYVETKIVADGIQDEKKFTAEELAQKADPKARLVSIRLFPFFGAETSDLENGYTFIPDGSGALIQFKKDRAGLSSSYNERVYGDDLAYSKNNNLSNREPVKMPVFGIKSGDQALLGIIRGGEEYASIAAAPSKTFSTYNWAAPEHHYRFKYFQPTNSKKTAGFLTYEDKMVKTDRTTRYYFLENEQADYVGMAAAYRNYLIQELGMKPMNSAKPQIPLRVQLLGADTKKGFLWDSFLPLTTADQATQIVRDIKSEGVDSMTIVYSGWQKGGYSSYGGHFPVDRRLGGNDGMKQFIDYAHNQGFSVLLDAGSYSFNNNGKDGFRRSRDALRDMGSNVIELTSWGNEGRVLVSPALVKKTIQKDISKVKSLGADGLLFGQAIGSVLNTDFNGNHPATREQSKAIQRDIFRDTQHALGRVQVKEGNFYSFPYADHVDGLFDDYSYDLFVDDKVPFAQIALHGLVSYSFDFANLSESYTENFLRGIEYGAVPSFRLTYEKSHKLVNSKSLRGAYSTNYKDWVVEMVSQYQRFNQALADVQDAFIIDHSKLSDGVYETVYSSGKRVWVNYNSAPYTKNEITVKPEDFAVVQEGAWNE